MLTDITAKDRFVEMSDGKRCRACALYRDECTCEPDHPLRQMGLLSPTTPRPLADQLGDTLERMIRVQMERFPAHWSDADRREMAMRDLGLGDERNG